MLVKPGFISTNTCILLKSSKRGSEGFVLNKKYRASYIIRFFFMEKFFLAIWYSTSTWGHLIIFFSIVNVRRWSLI